MTSYYAQINGIKMHYLKEGKGKLMLFLHGFPEYCGVWQEQIDAFKNEYCCVAPDLRGFNLTDAPTDPQQYKAKIIIEDFRALILHLGYENCILVAHDWGGANAWSFALAYPEMIEKLIILNAPHHVPFSRELATNEAQQKASDYMVWLRAPEAEELIKQKNFKKLFNFFSHSPTMLNMSDEKRQGYIESYNRSLGGLNYYRISPLMPRTAKPLNPQDFVVKVKTLVIWGMNDHALLPCLLEGLDKCVEDLTLIKLENATHWLIHEEPQRVTHEIRAFLRA
jgi:epoxide hydrolase 4